MQFFGRVSTWGCVCARFKSVNQRGKERRKEEYFNKAVQNVSETGAKENGGVGD